MCAKTLHGLLGCYRALLFMMGGDSAMEEGAAQDAKVSMVKRPLVS